MNSKKFFFILVLFMGAFCFSSFAQKCKRCNGYGSIMLNSPSVSHFGVPRKTGDCSICGHAVFQGERHQHEICPRCNGTGKESRNNPNSNNDKDYDGYDGVLTPGEYFTVEALAKMLFIGKTESRKCSTCNGTGHCPGPGLHHYGNFSALLDLDSPTPQYCPLCGGWGNCPNTNCIDGIEYFTRPLTELEKAEISNEIKYIYDNAYKREYGH